MKGIGPVLENYHAKQKEKVDKSEFVEIIGPVLKKLKEHSGILNDLNGSLPQIQSALSLSEKKLKTEIAKAKKEAKGTAQSQLQEFLSQIQELRQMLSDVPVSDEIDVEKVITEAVSRAKAEIVLRETTPEEMRDKLEALEGDEQFDIEQLKGKEPFIKGILDRAIAILDKRTEYLINRVSTLGTLIAGTVTSLTTTGTSGAATLINGVLNIPQYSGGAGFTVQIPTGSLNQGTFVFTTAPQVIVLDNATIMNKVSSDGTVNWTGTTTVVLNQAPNFNIYGF